MNVLYKRGTAVARTARLDSLEAPPELSRSEMLEPVPVQEPDPRELRIVELEREHAELRREIETLRERWDDELAGAEIQAKNAAAREFVRDDEARTSALAKTLDDAGNNFEKAIGHGLNTVAVNLASEALSRLVTPNTQDREWLVRAIERRIGELRSRSVIFLRVAPDVLTPEMSASLRERLSAGAAIEVDPDLRPGLAFIGLRLGSVTIDLSQGLGSIMRHLEHGDASR